MMKRLYFTAESGKKSMAIGVKGTFTGDAPMAFLSIGEHGMGVSAARIAGEANCYARRREWQSCAHTDTKYLLRVYCKPHARLRKEKPRGSRTRKNYAVSLRGVVSRRRRRHD